MAEDELAIALPIVGASGTLPGLILLEGNDTGPGPTAFVANTVKV